MIGRKTYLLCRCVPKHLLFKVKILSVIISVGLPTAQKANKGGDVNLVCDSDAEDELFRVELEVNRK